MFPNVFHRIKIPVCHAGYFDTAPTYETAMLTAVLVFEYHGKSDLGITTNSYKRTMNVHV
jgi:hypothetical protein